MNSEFDANDVSEGGSRILRHGEERPWAAPQGEDSIEAISNHIEKHLGPVATIYHEIVSDTVHLDVHIVEPREDFPFFRLVTSGMSDLPMTVPAGADVPRYAELIMTLPGAWTHGQDVFEDERWYWPVRLIKTLASLPHKYDTWLGPGHTVPNGNPAEPYAPDTALCGALIFPSATVPDAFHQLRIDDAKSIMFYSVVPLYAEEMRYKLKAGADKLLDRFDGAGITDIVDPLRPNVARKRFGLF